MGTAGGEESILETSTSKQAVWCYTTASREAGLQGKARRAGSRNLHSRTGCIALLHQLWRKGYEDIAFPADTTKLRDELGGEMKSDAKPCIVMIEDKAPGNVYVVCPNSYDTEFGTVQVFRASDPADQKETVKWSKCKIV